MAFPAEKEIRQAIKDELQAIGGEAKLDVLLPKVTQHLRAHFPDFTHADLQRKDPKTGLNSWNHHLHSVRSRMVKTQPPELDPAASRGVWRLSGIPPLPPPTEPDRLAEQIKGLLEKLVELAKKKEEELPVTHDEMVQKVKEMGEMLGKVTEPVLGVPYKHDCVWRDNPYATPKLVWEVCDKGNLDKDIASLIWTVKNWGANGILVTFGESDFYTAQKKLAQESQIHPLKAEDIL